MTYRSRALLRCFGNCKYRNRDTQPKKASRSSQGGQGSRSSTKHGNHPDQDRASNRDGRQPVGHRNPKVPVGLRRRCDILSEDYREPSADEPNARSCGSPYSYGHPRTSAAGGRRRWRLAVGAMSVRCRYRTSHSCSKFERKVRCGRCLRHGPHPGRSGRRYLTSRSVVYVHVCRA